MSEVFCPKCGDDVDPNHSGCGRVDCPYRDLDMPIEHVGQHKKGEHKNKTSRQDRFGFWEDYGGAVDRGEKPDTPQPPPPWKKS